MRKVWTDERTDHLRRLVAKGMPPSKIAEQLGCTRAAILGRAHRLDLALPSERETTESEFSLNEDGLPALKIASGRHLLDLIAERRRSGRGWASYRIPNEGVPHRFSPGVSGQLIGSAAALCAEANI